MCDILYISTNEIWSGSEELWSLSAKNLREQGFAIAIATKYKNAALDAFVVPTLQFSNRYPPKSLVKRIFERITSFTFQAEDKLKEFIKKYSPGLVVISQGDNIQAIDIMLLCKGEGIPYLTITQLVAETHLYAFNDNNLFKFREAYLGAKRNYFVSTNNLLLNNRMLGLELSNAEAVFNPCRLFEYDPPSYPTVDDGYKLGLVGRLDCYHKGYDLLIEVLKMEKWRNRPVSFNFYGEGPHFQLIRASIESYNLKTIQLRGYTTDVVDIWRDNHILLMPSRMEGQALSLIEAMWCNRAVIATNVGGVSELITDVLSGFIADAPTVKSIDSALEKAWENRSSWREMGIKAGLELRARYPKDSAIYLNEKLKEFTVPDGRAVKLAIE